MGPPPGILRRASSTVAVSDEPAMNPHETREVARSRAEKNEDWLTSKDRGEDG